MELKGIQEKIWISIKIRLGKKIKDHVGDDALLWFNNKETDILEF